MASPIALAAGGVGMAATMEGGRLARQGAGIQAAGARYQGEAQAAMYNYQSSIAMMNSRLASADADYTIQAGEVKADYAGLQGAQIIGEIKNTMAAGNIDMARGSAAQVLASQRAVNEANLSMIRANALKTAYGLRVQSAEDVAQANLYAQAAKTAPIAAEYQAQAAEIGGQASYLGAVASTATQFAKVAQAFPIPGLSLFGS